jgi:hypothetical protein
MANELYTDGTVLADQDDVDAYQLVLNAAVVAAAAELSRAEVQILIDADTDFNSASAQEVTVAADTKDGSWVQLTFPTDAGPPRWWIGVANEIATVHGGEATSNPYTVRVRKTKVQEHLDTIRPLLT